MSAAQALGIAQGATDYALEYAKTRKTMGKPIAQHQLIQAKLADMETECEAARGLLYRFGQMVDDGVDAELTKTSAMAKLKCGDVAMAVTTDAVQILGGYGYIKEYPVERFMRDAKITQIYEGTQEIQRLVIAREMLRESRAFLPASIWYASLPGRSDDEARRHPSRHLHHGRRAAERRVLHRRARAAAREEVRQPGRPDRLPPLLRRREGATRAPTSRSSSTRARARGRAGDGMVHTVVWRVGSAEALDFWAGACRTASGTATSSASPIRKGSRTSS